MQKFLTTLKAPQRVSHHSPISTHSSSNNNITGKYDFSNRLSSTKNFFPWAKRSTVSNAGDVEIAMQTEKQNSDNHDSTKSDNNHSAENKKCDIEKDNGEDGVLGKDSQDKNVAEKGLLKNDELQPNASNVTKSAPGDNTKCNPLPFTPRVSNTTFKSKWGPCNTNGQNVKESRRECQNLKGNEKPRINRYKLIGKYIDEVSLIVFMVMWFIMTLWYFVSVTT